MRRNLAIGLLIVPVLIAGCSSGGKNNDRAQTLVTKASTSTAEQVVPATKGKASAAQLQSVLIRVTDLPTGYSLDSTTRPSSDDLTGDSTSCAARFAALKAPTASSGPKDPEADFTGPGLGTVLQETLFSTDSPSQVEGKFSKFAAVVNDCPTFKSKSADGTAKSLTLAALSFPNLGDRTLAYAISIKTGFIDGHANLIFVQVGNNIMEMIQGGLATDAVALETAARAGVRRLQSING